MRHSLSGVVIPERSPAIRWPTFPVILGEHVPVERLLLDVVAAAVDYDASGDE